MRLLPTQVKAEHKDHVVEEAVVGPHELSGGSFMSRFTHPSALDLDRLYDCLPLLSLNLEYRRCHY